MSAVRQYMATSAYKGTSTTRPSMARWSPPSKSAAALVEDLQALRDRCADLDRNTPEATGATNQYVDYAVATGLWPESRVSARLAGITQAQADAWQEQAEELWTAWSESREASYDRRATFVELLEMALRTIVNRGDGFFFLRRRQSASWPFELAVQLIEGDRVGDPYGDAREKDGIPGTRLVDGVRIDTKTGEHVAYYVLDEHPGGVLSSQTSGTWVPVRKDGVQQVFQLLALRRPEQPRGIPWFAPIVEALHLEERYTDAELMAAVVAALFTVFVKSENGTGLAPQEDPYDASPSTEPGSYELGPGAILGLGPNDDVSMAQPNRPNSQFAPFVQAIQQKVGMVTGIPYEVLVMHFQASFSAARGAFLRAWKTMKRVRGLIASGMCTPTWEAFLAEQVAKGRLLAPGFFRDPLVRYAYCRAVWHGDAPGTLDPTKEVDASLRKIEGNLSTHAAEIAELSGGDYRAVFRQIGLEKQLLKASGLEKPTPPPAPAVAQPPVPPPPGPRRQAGDSDEELPEDETGGDLEDETGVPA